MIREHDLEKALFECDLCGEKYARRDRLKAHMTKHTGEKAHKCDKCGKRFARTDSLKRHMAVHTAEDTDDSDTC